MMKALVKIVAALIALIVIAAAGITGLIYTGWYDISTLNHDTQFVNWALDNAMTRSVQHHAKEITVPSLLAPSMIQIGVNYYKEMCASCHGAPGVIPDEIADGIWPPAPDLAKSVTDWTPAELF